MRNRLMYRVGAVVLAAGLFGACSSDNPTNGGGATQQPSGDTLTPVDPAVTTGDAGTTAPAPDVGADDLCTTIPDLAAIEAAIGLPVKDPLGVGDAGFQQTCTLLSATDDFPSVTFTVIPGGTIAGQIEFVSTNMANLNIEIVPLEGAEGFYAGEGDSVYWEGNGNLYQTSALIDSDSGTHELNNRAAALNLIKLWQGL